MSKYKYSSLLSSQYRQVFKSYHSLQRCQNQLKDNLAKSLHKRVNTQIDQIQRINSNFYYQQPQSSILHKSQQPYLYYKTKQNTVKFYEALANRTAQGLYPSKIAKRQQEAIRTQSNKFENFLFQEETGSFSKRTYCQGQQKNKLSDRISSAQQRKKELKSKVSQINKKRNNIKLKARVQDIDKINRKYDYLMEHNQGSQNDNREGVMKQEALLANNLAKNAPTRSNHIQNISKIKGNNASLNTFARFPLTEANSNKIFGPQNKRNINYLTHNSSPIYKDQQNIQTPHFHQEQVKKSILQPSLISMKLQNLVKNTFTDRF